MRRTRLPLLARPIGLAVVALALAACGGAASSPVASQAPASAAPPSAPGSAAGACAKTTDPTTVDVRIAEFAFDPASIEVNVGDVVTWSNEDSAPHSAVLEDGSCGTETLSQGSSGSLVFEVAGSYPYKCGIHASMKGTIEVN